MLVDPVVSEIISRTSDQNHDYTHRDENSTGASFTISWVVVVFKTCEISKRQGMGETELQWDLDSFNIEKRFISNL